MIIRAMLIKIMFFIYYNVKTLLLNEKTTFFVAKKHKLAKISTFGFV